MAKKVAIGNICSLMFFYPCFYNVVLIKVQKTCFYVFHMQINVLTSMVFAT